MRLEDEYSAKAAQDSQRRSSQSFTANRQIEQKARQPIEDESELAKALIQLGSVLGVQPKIERKRRK